MSRRPILLAGNLGTALACTVTRGTVVPAAIQEAVIWVTGRGMQKSQSPSGGTGTREGWEDCSDDGLRPSARRSCLG